MKLPVTVCENLPSRLGTLATERRDEVRSTSLWLQTSHGAASWSEYFAAAIAVLLIVGSSVAFGQRKSAPRVGHLGLSSHVLPRSGYAQVVYGLPQGFTGHATVHVAWTDSLGRTVADKTMLFDLIDETKIVFPIDLSKAIALRNHLEADLSLDGKDVKGQPYKRQAKAAADFISRPSYTGWNDYHIFMWQPYAPNLIPELRKLGIDGATYSSRDIRLPDYLIDTNTRWYSESVATDYYATYHYWLPDRHKEWAMHWSKDLYKEHPDSLEGFKRHPSFQDPYWIRKIHDRAVATAERLAPYRPYFYSLADESGIASLDDQWDFDMSDMSLVPMRRWLKKQYGTLGALNAEWGTHFTDWNLVMPATTNQAMERPGNNFSQWADFKEWMDMSFAQALKMGADAIHSVDPRAYVEIGGAQMPEWGGYDYARLTKVLDGIEPYDIGRNVDIIHSLNPDTIILNTSFVPGPWEEHRVWYELLHGNRGLILWDAKYQYVLKDGQPGERGKEAGKYYNEIRDGEGALIINSKPVDNLIGIHYSQPSMRTQWMLDERPHGKAWMSRGPKYEFEPQNKFMRLRVSWCDLIEDLGMQPDFISYMQVEDGDLPKRGFHVLVLPQSSSLSPAESRAIRQFVAAGGIAIANGVPGTYDQHSKELPKSSLDDLFGGPAAQQVNVRNYGKGKAILLKADITGYLVERLKGTAKPTQQTIGNLLRSNGVQPPFTLDDGSGNSPIGVEMHVYANGGVRVVAMESNPEIRASELGPPDFRSNERFSHPVSAHLHLPHAMYVYDTRAQKALGRHKELALTIDPYQPTILAASDAPLPEMQVEMPEKAHRGDVVNVAVHALPAQAETSVFNVEVQNPQGEKMFFYSGNIIANGGGVRSIPLAENDPAGTWTVTVHDIMSGQTLTRHIDVN